MMKLGFPTERRSRVLAVLILSLILLVLYVVMFVRPGVASAVALRASLPDDFILTLPFRGDHPVYVYCGYGCGYHTSVRDYYSMDFGMKEGEEVYAVAPGTVLFAGETTGNFCGYGIIVFIDHGNGYQTNYAHLKETRVQTGDVVDRTTLIGLAGDTSCHDFSPHLHFTLRRGSSFCDYGGSTGRGPCGGRGVPPEPMIGEEVYEGFGLRWPGHTSWRGPFMWSELASDATIPQPSWTGNATQAGQTVGFQQPVVLEIDSLPEDTLEVRLTTWYQDWSTMTADSENAYWRVLARCWPDRPQEDQVECQWTEDRTGLRHEWIPHIDDFHKVAPWLPWGENIHPAYSGGERQVCIGFEVYDRAGNHNLLPDVANCSLEGAGSASPDNSPRMFLLAPDPDLPTPTPTSSVPENVIGEVGRINDSLTTDLRTVHLSRTYTNPVVLVQPLSYDGPGEAVARITNIQPDRFTVYVQEAPNKGGGHATETVHYLVLEAGEWQLSDGTRLEVGQTVTNATVGSLPDDQWESVSFSNSFAGRPVVISQTQTYNDRTWVKTRHRQTGVDGFEVAMEGAESVTTSHGLETIGWLAIEPGRRSWTGHVFEAFTTAKVVTDSWYSLSFQDPFNMLPNFVASLASYNGSESAHLRFRNLSAFSVQVRVEEDTAADAETNHMAEEVDYIAIGGSGTLTGVGSSAPPPPPPPAPTATPTSTPTPQEDPGGSPTATPTPTPTPDPDQPPPPSDPQETVVGEVGRIRDALTHRRKTILLSRVYENPVVIAQPLSRDGRASAVVRITNVQPDRFTLYVDETPEKDGRHTTETVSYLVLEAGRWQLADGTVLEVGTVSTNATVGNRITNRWEVVNFSSPFSEVPVVISQVQSNNDGAYVTTRQVYERAGLFWVAMEGAERSRRYHGTETIGWVAIEPSMGSWSGHAYEARATSRGVTSKWSILSFLNTYRSAPQVLASIGTYFGPDSAHLRYYWIRAGGIKLKVEEDKSRDWEMQHKTEGVQLVVIGGEGTLSAVAASAGGSVENVDPGPPAAPIPTATPTATSTPTPTATWTPVPTSTLAEEQPPTSTPTPTPTGTPTSDAPASNSDDPPISAKQLSSPPTVDGDLSDWEAGLYTAREVVYGSPEWTGEQDLSATFAVGWDASALYVSVSVVDDVFVQISQGTNLYKGDSVEFLFDADLLADYDVGGLNGDDYQVGLSPGDFETLPVEAFLWYPQTSTGPIDTVAVAAVRTEGGYELEAAIPWSVLGVQPRVGDTYGFAFSVSDNDQSGTAVQQSMISSASSRLLGDPGTWGTLELAE